MLYVSCYGDENNKPGLIGIDIKNDELMIKEKKI